MSQDFRGSRGLFLGNQQGSLRATKDPFIRRRIRDGEFETGKDLRAMEVWARDGFISIPGHSVELIHKDAFLGPRVREYQDETGGVLPLGFHIEQEDEEEE